MDRIEQLKNKIEKSIDLIKTQYLADDNNLPWLIGYSGGKDSTCTAQLVFKAAWELKQSGIEVQRKVIIFSSDTMIENPLVKSIVENNVRLINEKANELGLPISAEIQLPKIDRTFWVNIIGRGYPNPNTSFRWCTDRMKIEPANTFVKKRISEAGEVIMILGVRDGESGTRDRTLSKHTIDGTVLMKHSSLTNAYVFAPIRHLDTTDIFLYLNVYESPWGGNNKQLYFFYEESGGGECPIFLSKEDKTSSNSCGNSRLGCWCCTVVEKDKSLTGFIETGWHDELKPLLEFRNWLTSIRDEEKYRSFYRLNGTVYTRKLQIKEDQDGKFLLIPQKGSRKKTIIRLRDNGDLVSSNYVLIDKDSLSEYMKENDLSFKDNEISRIILKDKITDEYYRIGTGSYNETAKKEIFYNLLKTENEYNTFNEQPINLIVDEEIVEIKKLWLKSSIDCQFIDDTLSKFGRKPVEIVQDSFEMMNKSYESKIKSILDAKGLDYELLNTLVLYEKEIMNNPDKNKMQVFIDQTFKSDKFNY